MLGLRKKQAAKREVLIRVFPDCVHDYEYEADNVIVQIGKEGWGWLVYTFGEDRQSPEQGEAKTKEQALKDAEAWAKEWLSS